MTAPTRDSVYFRSPLLPAARAAYHQLRSTRPTMAPWEKLNEAQHREWCAIAQAVLAVPRGPNRSQRRALERTRVKRTACSYGCATGCHRCERREGYTLDPAKLATKLEDVAGDEFPFGGFFVTDDDVARDIALALELSAKAGPLGRRITPKMAQAVLDGVNEADVLSGRFDAEAAYVEVPASQPGPYSEMP